MDLSALPGLAYEHIALHGYLGLTLPDLWQKIENGKTLDAQCREFIWQQLTSMDSLYFYESISSVQEPFLNLPKVLYNNEKTLAVVETLQEASELGSATMGLVRKDSSWKDVSLTIREGSFSHLEAHNKYGAHLRIVVKNPEITQLNGVWDPMVPLPLKCSLLVNYLSRQGVEGALSCGVSSPLNASIGVKSTTIFHLKKISNLYNLIRWRKILVKKARLSRSTTSGTSAVLTRFVSPAFLLPDRMITLAKQLADYIVKTSPSSRTMEVRQCTAALGWSGKKFRSVLNAFPDYFSLGCKKPSNLVAESESTFEEQMVESDESKLGADENKGSQRAFRTVTLQKQMGAPLKAGAASAQLNKQLSPADEDQEPEDNESEEEEEEDNNEDEGSNSVDSNDEYVLGQLYSARCPLRVVWENIASSGAAGVTLQELRSMPNLGILLSMLRRYIKMLVSAGYIKWANDQLGRQHVKRYFAVSATVELPPERHSPSLADVKVEKRCLRSKKGGPAMTEVASSSTIISPVPTVAAKSPAKSIFSASLVASARKQVIETCLADRRALLLSEITAKLRTVDSKIQGSIDRRTVQRLVNELVSEQRISCVVKPLKSSGNVAVYTAFGVDPDDEAVTNAVARRDRCVKPVAVPVSDETELICGPLRVRQVNSGRVTLLYPKMQRVEALHSFLWFLVYGEGNKLELSGLLATCAADIGKPIKSEDTPLGWMRLSTALDAMPLRLLAFICPVSLAILSPAAITAAINSGLTFSQLAPDLRASALHTWGSFSLAGELREQILVLNALCLVTFVERRSHSTSHLRTYIYIHRASPISPLPLAEGDAKEAANPSPVTSFNTFKDVVMFWSDLRNESILSPASRMSPSASKPPPPSTASGETKQPEKTKKSRLAELSKLSFSVANFESVPIVRPRPLGNGLGPGGSDSRIRLSVSTFWNACKWTAVPRLDEENQTSGLTLRRRTKLMALAGNYRRRRRNNLSVQPATSGSKRKRVVPNDSENDLGPSSSSQSRSPSKLSKTKQTTKESQRKRTGEAMGEPSTKRLKTNAVKPKGVKIPSDASVARRRRRRVIHQQNIVTHADASDIAEDSKMYKTLQNLIDTLAAHDAFYSSADNNSMTAEGDDDSGLKSYAERDLATLALLTFHACVTVSASPENLQSQLTPPFQDVRRSAVFPSLEVANRGWVSHAVDLLDQLYPAQKRTGLVFQFVLAAVDLLLADETTREQARHPEYASGMKSLWVTIYNNKLKNPDFHRETFSRLRNQPGRSHGTSVLPLKEHNIPRLRVVGNFWGPTGNDMWSRPGLFLPLYIKSDANLVEEENRIRGCIAEQTMCAFLICSRLTQSLQAQSQPQQAGPVEEMLMFDQTIAGLDPSQVEHNRSGVYNQLVASNCVTIQRALARLMSAKILKRDFVDSLLYTKKTFNNPQEDESADAHIGDYSLTSNVRFQIVSQPIVRCSNVLSRIGSFLLKTATSSNSRSDLLTFDLRSTDPTASIFRVFTSPIGVVSLASAMNAKHRQFTVDLDIVPVDQLVFSSELADTDNTAKNPRKNPPIELSVWPLVMQIEKQQLQSFAPIHDIVPQPSSLKYPAKLTAGESCYSDPFAVPNEVLSAAILERLPTCKMILSDLIAVYRAIEKCGVAGCSFRELPTEKHPVLKGHSQVTELVAHLTIAELVVSVGYAEERLVATSIAHSVWFMNSPIMFPWPWSNADGSVNWQVLRTLLTSIVFIIVDWPGITDLVISKRLGSSIAMVALNRMLQMLEEAGVVAKVEFRAEKKLVGLFDEPADVTAVSDGKSADISKIYWMKPDGLLKLSVLTCASVYRQSRF